MGGKAVAFSVHALLRTGTSIPASSATIVGSVRAADLGARSGDLGDYLPDWLLGLLRCLVAVFGVVITQLGVVITQVSSPIAHSRRAVSFVGCTIAAISRLSLQNAVVSEFVTGHSSLRSSNEPAL